MLAMPELNMKVTLQQRQFSLLILPKSRALRQNQNKKTNGSSEPPS